MSRVKVRLARCAAAVLGLLAGAPFAAAPEPGAEQLENGRRMYHEGLLPTGEQITAIVRGDVSLGGEIVICGTCHRRSGLGSSEGEQVIPAVAAEALFTPLRLPTSTQPSAPLQRPAYDHATLKRAIREGIDANGQPMDPLMPRYASLTDADLDTLIAYLRTLSATPSPGVDERDIHFATIVAGPVAPEKRKALLDVMQVYLEQKNRETRYETKRKEHPMWHKQWMFAPYRKWVLHVWEIDGPSETWRAQLDALYQERPVFAVLSGVAEGSWRPMHEFCETTRLPCLFPTTDLPVIAEDDFYPVYLSKGMTLEGEIISRHRQDAGDADAALVQVFREHDERARTAAAALQASRGGMPVRDVVWRDKASRPDAAFWSKLLDDTQGTALSLWMSADDTMELWPVLASRGGSAPQAIYLSTTLFGADPESLPAAARERVLLVHTRELPSRLNRLLARSTGWFRVKKIYAPQLKQVQANAYFALKVIGDALRHARGYFFRDYVLERIEHMLDSVPYTSVYPRISLAPEQRFASKGGYITRFTGSERPTLVAVTDWFTP